MICFFNDTDLITSSPEGNLEDMVTSMQGALDICQGVLRTTVGLLDWSNHTKCYWYCINYVWSEYGLWGYAKIDPGHTLTMLDDSGRRKLFISVRWMKQGAH